MTVVLVHGNPETAAVWDPLVDSLTELGVPEPVRLSPPGFGARVPAGWSATVTEYRDWLIGELAAFDEPVDLVGHDWGGGHAINVVMARPELVRSWCSDVPGVFDPDYVWHDLAQVWQAPGDGEAAVAGMTAAAPEARAAALVEAGMAPAVAEKVAPGMNAVMGECILRLYRSAAQPVMAELGADLESAAARPGLAVLPSEDFRVGTDEQRRRSAERAGARIENLDGLGHWWFTQDPDRAARLLTDFWKSL